MKEVRKFWREGCTFQFFQPQQVRCDASLLSLVHLLTVLWQHSDTLHRLIAGLEQHFGALVGANIYMTPPNAQGLGNLPSSALYG